MRPPSAFPFLTFLVCAAPAMAGAPSPVTSTLPCGVVLVGTNEHGDADPAGAFTGFGPPVASPPARNSENAGRTIPVKFTLAGSGA